MAGPKSHPKRKKLSHEARLGQKGINLVEEIVLDMGSRWIPGGPTEVGIDGYIEIFDPATGEAVGKTVAVQSKAVTDFAGENDQSFTYQCDKRDIRYWTEGNLPVILVVSRPSTKEAYWISIKDYFGAEKASGSTVNFSKARHRFGRDSFRELIGFAETPDVGVALAPSLHKESLFSNLVEIVQLPPKLYKAATGCRTIIQVWQALGSDSRNVGGDWIVREKNILGFEDFSHSRWSGACGVGSTESFEVSEWSDSDDPDRLRVFVQLLNRCLRRQLEPEVRYWPIEDCYAFEADPDQREVRLSYRSVKRRSTITVVSRFEIKNTARQTILCFRHLAFHGRFRRVEGRWFLEITPTYRFTRDGIRLDRFHSDKLSGIKRLEGNRAVLSSVLFWSRFLGAKDDLFARKHRTIVFGLPATFEIPVGINDSQWSTRDPGLQPSKPTKAQEMFLPYLEMETEE